MNDQEAIQCLSIIEDVYDDEAQVAKVAALGGAFAAFRKIVEWLRANGVNLSLILDNLTAIIAILSSNDSWGEKIAKLIAIFFPTGTFTIAAPTE